MGNPQYRTQGKCSTCRVRHTWPERLGPFRGARCPRCGALLERTTHLSTLPVTDWPHGLGKSAATVAKIASTERQAHDLRRARRESVAFLDRCGLRAAAHATQTSFPSAIRDYYNTLNALLHRPSWPRCDA